MKFRELLEAIDPKYNEIMKLITKKYGDVKFENSMGSLEVIKDKVTIGLINRRSIDKWEEIINKKLELIKNKKSGDVADEINVDMRGYKPGN